MTSKLDRVAVLALALVVFGCGPDPKPEPSEPMLIEPKVSVGPIKAGMTTDEVVGLLGEPQLRTANALEYKRLGFAVMHGPDKVIQVVMCGDVTGLNGPLVKAFTGRTKEGIGLTSTREEVVNAYGQPTSSQKFLGGRESLRYDQLGITFSLEGEKVHHLIVRLTAPEPGTRTIDVTR